MLFVVLLTSVDKLFTASEHEVDHERELMRHSGVGAWLIHTRA